MDFLTDEQMAALEKASPNKGAVPPDTLTDEEMEQLDTSYLPQDAPGTRVEDRIADGNLIRTPKGRVAEEFRKINRSLYNNPDGPTKEQVGGAARNALGAISGGVINKFAPGLVKGALASGAIGAASAPEDHRLAGFLLGTGSQLVSGAAQKAFQGAKGAVGDYLRARADVRNPGQLDDTAQAALNEVIEKLPAAEAEKVYATLRGKNFEFNPKDYMGISPKADSILKKYTSSFETPIQYNNGQNKILDTTAKTSISGADTYDVRKALDAEGRLRSTHGALISQPVHAGDREAFDKANELRGLMRANGGGEVTDAIGSLRGAIEDAQAMQRAGKFEPVKFFDNPSLGRAGLMQNADKTLGTNLRELSRRVSNAADVHAHPYQSIPKIMGRGLSDGLEKPATATPVTSLEAFISTLMRKK